MEPGTELDLRHSGNADLIRAADIMQFLPAFEPGLEQEEMQKTIAVMEKYQNLTPEDQRVLAAYKALEGGRQLVSLAESILRAGRTTDQMPKVAVTQYGLPGVQCWMGRNGTISLRDPRPDQEGWSGWKMKRAQPWSWKFDKLFPESGSKQARTGHARAPYVPVEHRPEDPTGKLVFWEPDWSVDPIPVPRPRVHIDPAILEHVVGDLYVVIAVWDLTPIEAAALDG